VEEREDGAEEGISDNYFILNAVKVPKRHVARNTLRKLSHRFFINIKAGDLRTQENAKILC
jgi:hypothetical protein